jgi:hypothetical protein
MATDLYSRAGQRCCSNGLGGCSNISKAGGQAVDLCTAGDDKNVYCVDCSKVGAYLSGLVGSCGKDGMVGGQQDIVEAQRCIFGFCTVGMTIQV